MKKFIALFLAAVMCFGLVACGSDSSTPAATQSSTSSSSNVATENNAAAIATTSERSKVVTIATSEGMASMDPQDGTTITLNTVIPMIWGTLLESDHTGNITPCLAESYTISEDGKDYSFTMKEGVVANDGEVINADDAICSIQRIIDNPTLAAAASWTYLESVEKIDDMNFIVHMSAPYAPSLALFAQMPIIPNEAYAKLGVSMFTEQKITGAGPWTFVEWIDGQYIHLKKNENYWDKSWDSYFDEVYIRTISEASTAISGMLSGEVDVFFNFPSDLKGMFDGHDEIEIINTKSSSMLYLQFQCSDKSIFNDVNVRRAFSMAIDRQAIADALTDGYTPALGFTSDKTMGYDPDFSCEYYDYNPEAAKELLASTSYDGSELEIISFSGVSSAQQLMLAICEYANAVGFNCKCEVVEVAQINERRATGEYDMFMISAVNQNGDLWHTTAWRIANDAHHHNYQNDELKQLLLDALAETNQETRNELYRKANVICCEECAPYITLWSLANLSSVRRGLTGVEIYSDGLYELKDISYDPSLAK